MSDGKFKEKKIPEWNLIGRIRQAREKNRRQMEEEAAAEVTNTMAENAMKICTILQSTSFVRSKLPKTEPGQEPGDSKHTVDYYEKIAKKICSDLVEHPDSASVDLRKLDTKIIVLSKLFKNAVEAGYPLMAEMSRICLVRAVGEVRKKAYERESDKEALARYIKEAEDLLDQYIETVDFAYEVDVMDKNIEHQSAQLEKQKEKIDISRDSVFQEARENQAVNEAVLVIMKDDSDHKDTVIEGRIRSHINELYLDNLILKLRAAVLEDTKSRAQMARGQCDAMRSFMDANEILGLDPDRLKRFEDRVQQFFENMSRHDAEYEKQAKSFFSIDESLDALREQPGHRIQRMVQSKVAGGLSEYFAERIAAEEREKNPNGAVPSGGVIELAKQKANKMLEDARLEHEQKLKEAAERVKNEAQRIHRDKELL